MEESLQSEYPSLSFRHRTGIEKREINEVLRNIDPELGQTLFVEDSSIKPDGGIIEVKDNNDNWGVVLVSEAKYQGKDIDNIRRGILVGKNKFVSHNDKTIMLQAVSIYTKEDGGHWHKQEEWDVMLDIAKTSLKVLASDLFKQLTK